MYYIQANLKSKIAEVSDAHVAWSSITSAHYDDIEMAKRNYREKKAKNYNKLSKKDTQKKTVWKKWRQKSQFIWKINCMV